MYTWKVYTIYPRIGFELFRMVCISRDTVRKTLIYVQTVVLFPKDLDQDIRNSLNQAVRDLVETIQIHRTTVKTTLKSPSFTINFDRWIPHHLNAIQREGRVGN